MAHRLLAREYNKSLECLLGGNMRIGDLVTSDRFEPLYIGIVKQTDFECHSMLTVFVYWLKSGLVSWEDPNHLEIVE